MLSNSLQEHLFAQQSFFPFVEHIFTEHFNIAGGI